MKLTAVGLVSLASAVGCAPAAPPVTSAATLESVRPPLSSGTPLERYLPLIGGQVYQYEFETDAGEKGLLPVKVERTDDRHGAWLLPGGGNAFEYTSDGILTTNDDGQSYLLQTPLEVGRRFRGGHQSTIEIRRLDATATVPAGSYSGCVETFESRGGDAPFSVTAVYCPKVGMVQRDVVTGPHHERLVLKSFGAPVSLGPDGVSVTKGD